MAIDPRTINEFVTDQLLRAVRIRREGKISGQRALGMLAVLQQLTLLVLRDSPLLERIQYERKQVKEGGDDMPKAMYELLKQSQELLDKVTRSKSLTEEERGLVEYHLRQAIEALEIANVVEEKEPAD